MFLWVFSLFSLYLCNYLASAQCEYTSNGGTLNLDDMVDKGVVKFQTGSTWYSYSACENSATCGSTSYMVSQGKGTAAPETECQAYLAVYQDSIKPIFNATGLTWTFSYSNGQSAAGCPNAGNRKLSLVYKCDKTASTYSTITVVETSTCSYTMTILSELACGTSSSSSSSSSSDEGISGGWVFIIILLVCLFLYCVIGYIFVGRKNEHGFGDFKNNIPNATFWTLLPKYVMAGCSVSKDYVVGLANRNKNSEAPTSSSTD